jgi:hypothetical protein
MEVSIFIAMDPKDFQGSPQDSQYQRALELISISASTGEQKSEGWLQERLEVTTASDVSSCFDANPFKSRRQFIKEKVEKKPSHFRTLATSWGDKYEPIVVRIYEDIYEHQRPELLQDPDTGQSRPCRVWHMGLLTTREYCVDATNPETGEVTRREVPIGASIDGLVPVVGDTHLLEIKAPFSRKPYDPENPNLEEYGDLEDTGYVKRNYWMQTQTQMHVTKIDQCAFFDTQFQESIYEEDEIPGVRFEAQVGSPNDRPKVGLSEMYPNRYYGYFLSEGRGTSETVRYPMDSAHGWERIILDPDRALEWCFENATPTENIVRWDLVHYMLRRIQRDHKWFQEGLTEIDRTWCEVLEHRRNGTLPEKPPKSEEPKVRKPRASRKKKDDLDLGLPEGVVFPGSRKVLAKTSRPRVRKASLAVPEGPCVVEQPPKPLPKMAIVRAPRRQKVSSQNIVV